MLIEQIAAREQPRRRHAGRARSRRYASASTCRPFSGAIRAKKPTVYGGVRRIGCGAWPSRLMPMGTVRIRSRGMPRYRGHEVDVVVAHGEETRPRRRATRGSDRAPATSTAPAGFRETDPRPAACTRSAHSSTSRSGRARLMSSVNGSVTTSKRGSDSSQRSILSISLRWKPVDALQHRHRHLAEHRRIDLDLPLRRQLQHRRRIPQPIEERRRAAGRTATCCSR